MKRDNSSQASIDIFFEKKRKVSSDSVDASGELVKLEELVQIDLVSSNDDLVDSEDRWDSFHVKLPCSRSHVMKIVDHPSPISMWKVICKALQAPIGSCKALKDAILAYNPKYEKKWDFLGLLFYFEKVLSDEERELFFLETLPFIIETALALPELVQKPIPLLIKHANKRVTLTRHQGASLLANMFLCTFPRRSNQNEEYQFYPTVNFNSLYAAPCTKVKQNKLKCIIHYFERIAGQKPLGDLTFERQVMDDFPEWSELPNLFNELHVFSTGTIEDDGKNMLQVDFANRYIGGGVLGNEEIRFLVSPELIISRLLTAEIEDNESVIMKGSERYSMYSGYAKSFEYIGDYVDETERDENNNIKSSVLAIDALDISRNPLEQYSQDSIQRELNKAYAGFDTEDDASRIPIASGNWGCGVFGGHKHIKSLIQLMAAAYTGRVLNYFTFGDTRFCKKLQSLHTFLVERQITVGQLYGLIERYSVLVFDPDLETVPALFKFIRNAIENNDSTQEMEVNVPEESNQSFDNTT